MLNLLKIYDNLLELDHLGVWDRKKSLQGIFKRDFINNTLYFRSKLVRPTPKEGQTAMDVLFHHLTTCEGDCKEKDEEKKREYDRFRSIRVHWIRHHICEKTPEALDIFSTRDKQGIRTYIYDKTRRYVIVLEPRKNDSYYLLTAYYLSGGGYYKIESKSKRRLSEIL